MAEKMTLGRMREWHLDEVHRLRRLQHPFPNSSTVLSALMEMHQGMADLIEAQQTRVLYAAPPASPAGVPDVSKLQRYFPSLPTHPGWQMSPTPLGEWVLFADVQAMIAPEGDDQMQDVNAKQLTPDEALATHKKWERHFRQSE